MSNIIPTPRWMCMRALIPYSVIGTLTPQQLSPVAFMNSEAFDWNLHWLAIVAEIDATRGAHGWANDLQIKVGISQYGSINLVWSSLNNFTYMDNPIRQHELSATGTEHKIMDFGASLHFPRYPLIPADSGLDVVVQNMSTDDTQTKRRIGLLAQGYQELPRNKRKPFHLAGQSKLWLTSGQTDQLDCADLLNNGRDDVYLTDLTMTAGGYLDEGSQIDANTCDPTLSRIGFRINPTTGIPWMPDPTPMPVGCIAPFNRMPFDAYDDGPRTYKFPLGFTLKHRQRLDVLVRSLNQTAKDIPIYIALFGTLEVR